jgi:hypothetical protein
MNIDMLDDVFKSYIEDSNPSIIKQMNLKLEDYEKASSMAKKKILLNVIGIKSSLSLNPNSGIKEYQKDDFADYLLSNWSMLN